GSGRCAACPSSTAGTRSGCSASATSPPSSTRPRPWPRSARRPRTTDARRPWTRGAAAARRRQPRVRVPDAGRRPSAHHGAMTDQTTPLDPTAQHPDPDTQSAEQIAHPGHTEDMQQEPDHGEESYRGSGRLEGRRALITGGDSGIGRAVAIAFAREGADVAIAYLPEEADDAREALRWR